MEELTWEQWFDRAWTFREDSIYRTLFGDTGPGIYTLDADLFKSVFRQESVDPRWLSEGVFECPPSSERQSWLYVTSGLSNAWEAESPHPGEPSGLGCEFLFECPQQSRWALIFLRKMLAFQLLLSAGRFPGKGPLNIWDRIPLRAPIDGVSSTLTWVVLVPSPSFQETQQLPSGKFQFLEFVGITEDEAEYARNCGGDRLLELLTLRNSSPISDPTRESVLAQS